MGLRCFQPVDLILPQPNVGGKEYYYLLNHVEFRVEYKNMKDGTGRVVAVKIKPTSYVKDFLF